LDNNLVGPLIITDANTLTLGVSSINMLTANTNATLNFSLALGGSQTWSVGLGYTLMVGGVISDVRRPVLGCYYFVQILPIGQF
jgi:hypothetical protein